MNYRIAEGLENLKTEDVERLLKTTYWANMRSAETTKKALQNSVCYGVYVEGIEALVGFARVITDHATAYYLCDGVIDEAYRHQGLGKALLSHIEKSPEYVGLRGFLITRDAQPFYQKFGFEVVNDRIMVKSPKR